MDNMGNGHRKPSIEKSRHKYMVSVLLLASGRGLECLSVV